MIDDATKNRLLELYPALKQIPEQALDRALAGARLVRAPANSVLFEEGTACFGLPFPLAGQVRLVKSSSSGRELHLYDIGPGDVCVLSVNGLLGDSTYPARGVVTNELEAVLLPPPVFQALLDASAEFRDHVFGSYSKRLSVVMTLLSDVAFLRLDQRLAAALLSRPSPLTITHQQLADELGSIREVVSRALKALESNGWIALARGRIDILDAPALQNLVEC